MATRPSSQMLQNLTRRARRCSICANSTAQAQVSKATRQFSMTAVRGEESSQAERPRWSYTPEQMKAPFQPRIKDVRKAWAANEDPAKLDSMYIKLLGNGGDKVLSDEVKWLAVTHKSFDQGRRGFNDRLAFFGKRILLLQGTLAILHSPLSTSTPAAPPDPYGRTPFRHPALDGLSNLTAIPISEVLSKQRLGQLSRSYGIGEVTRWKPRNPQNLDGSGQDVVFTTSLYAIIGALALQKGADLANQVAHERILRPLGL